MELKGKKINFLGDSITEGSGVLDRENNMFYNRIAKSEGAIVRAYGVGGTRIAIQLDEKDRDGRDFNSRALEMDKDADIVVVFGGTNDFGHGSAPMGTFSDREDDTFYGGMHKLCRYLLETYTDATIVFMTPLHRCFEDNILNEIGIRRSSLETYVNVIQEVCAYYAIPVLDLYRTSGINPEVPAIRQKYMPDGLHPNDDGHSIMASRLIGFLKSL